MGRLCRASHPPLILSLSKERGGSIREADRVGVVRQRDPYLPPCGGESDFNILAKG